jgi:hypothetical protein
MRLEVQAKKHPQGYHITDYFAIKMCFLNANNKELPHLIVVS